jgi:hypothetical protein
MIGASGLAVAASGHRRYGPLSSEWYDLVFAMRNGSGVGAHAPSYTAGPTWAAATTGASDNGSTTTISGTSITAVDIDFLARLLVVSGNSGTVQNSKGTYNPSGGVGAWLVSGDDSLLENVTIDNSLSPVDGSPPLFYHGTTANGIHTLRRAHFKSSPTDPVKAPGAGILRVEWCFFDGYYLGAAGVHLDMIDMKSAGASSYVTDSLFIGDMHPSSPFTSATPSTGLNAMIRCVSSDTHGYDGSGRTYERLIFVGSNDVTSGATMLSFTSATATGVSMYDCLYDLREHNNLLASSVRVEDWYVRPFDYAASVAAGRITGIGAPTPFPNLASQPATVPSPMAAPVITAATGGFTYAAMARPWNQRSLITGYTIEYSFNGTTWTPAAASLDGGFLATPSGTGLRARVFATNGVGPATASASSNIVTIGSNLELVDETGATTFTTVPNLRVKVGAGAWQTPAAAGLTLARTAAGKITVSGFANLAAGQSAQWHYEQQIPGEPNSASGVRNALMVRNTTGGNPINSGLVGHPVSATDAANPVATT